MLFKLSQFYINNKNFLIIFFLSGIFAFTIQQFLLFKGNIVVIIHAIEIFGDNKLQNDWIASQTDHIPIFTYINYILIKLFSIKILYFVHFILLSLCALSLFLISKSIYTNLEKSDFIIVWFTLFILIFHENSFFSGVAGQSIIDAGYQPASYGVLFFLGIYFFLINKNFLSILLICISASFHPTYIIHSGFLVLGFSMYFFLFKKYSDLFKIFLYYSLFILPITIFVFFNFLNLDRDTTILGQEILMKRIPHHADIHYWFSYKDIILIITFFISLILIRDKTKLFISLGIFGFCSIFLSIIQYFVEINSLALIFPWRSSVFLMPISSIIIISFLIDKFREKLLNKKKLIYVVFFSISIFFGLKSHILENLNSNFEKKIFLFNKIKKYYKEIDSILVPIDTVSIRLNTGLPIFINHKHHPFKHNEIIDWDLRLKLASNFYNAKNLDLQNQFLKEIIELEKISHILFKKSQFYPECKDLINDDDYILIEISDCYKN